MVSEAVGEKTGMSCTLVPKVIWGSAFLRRKDKREIWRMRLLSWNPVWHRCSGSFPSAATSLSRETRPEGKLPEHGALGFSNVPKGSKDSIHLWKIPPFLLREPRSLHRQYSNWLGKPRLWLKCASSLTSSALSDPKWPLMSLTLLVIVFSRVHRATLNIPACGLSFMMIYNTHLTLNALNFCVSSFCCFDSLIETLRLSYV